MSKLNKKQVTNFAINGSLIGFVFKDSQIKGLRLQTDDGECDIKLAKHLRANCDLLLPGTQMQVIGEKQLALTGEVKLKALQLLTETAEISVVSAPVRTILVCQKSDCRKRGGKEVCEVMAATFSKLGISEQVKIKGTGCMKNCKAGPNLVMPDKTRYSRVKASQIPGLIDKHFLSTPEATALANSDLR